MRFQESQIDKVENMTLNASRSEQFAEALYFLVMSSTLKEGIKAAGGKYGLSGKALRNEVILFGRRWAQMTNRPVSSDVRGVRQAI